MILRQRLWKIHHPHISPFRHRQYCAFDLLFVFELPDPSSGTTQNSSHFPHSDIHSNIDRRSNWVCTEIHRITGGISRNYIVLVCWVRRNSTYRVVSLPTYGTRNLRLGSLESTEAAAFWYSCHCCACPPVRNRCPLNGSTMVRRTNSFNNWRLGIRVRVYSLANHLLSTTQAGN